MVAKANTTEIVECNQDFLEFLCLQNNSKTYNLGPADKSFI